MKAIIWDLEGTLIDTFTANIENLKRLLKQENILSWPQVWRQIEYIKIS